MAKRQPQQATSTVPSAPGIYGLCDPAGELRYIGQTRNLAKRIRQHMRVSGAQGDTARERWLRGLAKRDERPTVLVLELTADLDAAEMAWIARARQDGVRLLNANDGGPDMRQAREGAARGDWAARHTPIQAVCLTLSRAIRDFRRQGDDNRAERLEGKYREVRAALRRARRRGRAEIARINAALARRHPHLASAA